MNAVHRNASISSFRLVVRLAGIDREGYGFTQDLSGRGVFFYTDFQVAEGDAVELTLVMPAEITLTENMRVRCRGQVTTGDAGFKASSGWRFICKDTNICPRPRPQLKFPPTSLRISGAAWRRSGAKELRPFQLPAASRRVARARRLDRWATAEAAGRGLAVTPIPEETLGSHLALPRGARFFHGFTPSQSRLFCIKCLLQMEDLASDSS